MGLVHAMRSSGPLPQVIIYCTYKFLGNLHEFFGGQGKGMSCSMSRTMSMGVVSNGTEAGGGMIDAKTVPRNLYI